MDKHLTEVELAQRWGITTRTLQNWRNRGLGLPFMEVGPSPTLKTIRYRLSDIVAYEERHLNGGIPDHCKKAMRRAADALEAVAAWSSAPEKAKPVIVDIRDQLRGLLGEAA